MRVPIKNLIVGSAFATALFALPQVGKAALGDNDLKVGMKDSDVKELQSMLKEKGYFKYHTATGYYGSITQQAVKDFQAASGLSKTGVFDQETYMKLVQNPVHKVEIEKTSITTGKTLTTLMRTGSTGSDVSMLQEQLKSLGYFTYPSITTYYGTITADTVKKFQKDHGLVVDGIAGPNTLGKIQEKLNLKKPTAPVKVEVPQTTVADPTSTPKPKPTATTTVKYTYGTTGEEVKKIQARLKVLGYFTYPSTTTFYGTLTMDAVKKFQQASMLPVTGDVDDQTYEKLFAGSPTTSNNDTSFNAINLVGDAAELLGTSYVWGGSTPKGFDCSGFLVYVFEKQNISLPRTVATIWNKGKTVSTPSVGDIVFFETYQPGASHAGIYIGNNQFIHSGSSTGVTISHLNHSYWNERYLGAKKYH